MIDGMGERRVLQANSRQLGHAPLTRRSKNGFCASTVSCLRAPGLCIAKNYSVSRRPEHRPTRIRAQQKRSRRLSRLFDTLDCSDRSAERCWPPEVSNVIEPRIWTAIIRNGRYTTSPALRLSRMPPCGARSTRSTKCPAFASRNPSQSWRASHANT
jgi:hypothetical protein